MDNEFDLAKMYGISVPSVTAKQPESLLYNTIPEREKNYVNIQNEETENSAVKKIDTIDTVNYIENQKEFLQFVQEPKNVMMQKSTDATQAKSTTKQPELDINANALTQLTKKQNDVALLSTNPTSITQDLTYSQPTNMEGLHYLNGFLRTQIGRRIEAEFIFGSNSNNIIRKSGFLLGVGVNYILINEVDSEDIFACDFYNLKFIRLFY
ncbi:MAG: hypothetical protein Q8876_04875 [Bacillota bacterium]|nr:hypothetical protein [Bacillota bacterium]